MSRTVNVMHIVSASKHANLRNFIDSVLGMASLAASAALFPNGFPLSPGLCVRCLVFYVFAPSLLRRSIIYGRTNKHSIRLQIIEVSVIYLN